jgi:hypothetical protein
MNRRRDTRTLDLLAWEPASVVAAYADDVAGKGALDNRIARLVSRALRDAKDDHGLSRDQVAELMSGYLQREISAAQLNHWASEANDDRRIPLDAFAALIHATGADQLLGFLPNLFGFVAVPARYADLIELHEIEEHERQVAARKAAVQSKMRAAR